jgi:hypothetical protein
MRRRPDTASTPTTKDRLARIRAKLGPRRLRAIAAWIARITESAARFIERIRTALLLISLFALVVVGLHVGCDRLDDQLFAIFNGVDAFFDEIATHVIEHVGEWFDASDESVAAVTYRAVDFVDVSAKTSMARFVALIAELAADAVTARYVFSFRKEDLLKTALDRRYFDDVAVLKIAGPLTVVCASLMGALSLSREIKVAVHGVLRSGVVASFAAVVVLVLVALRLAFPASMGAIACADRRAADRPGEDRAARRRRRLRGLDVALVPLPVALIAFHSTSILRALSALVSW